MFCAEGLVLLYIIPLLSPYYKRSLALLLLCELAEENIFGCFVINELNNFVVVGLYLNSAETMVLVSYYFDYSSCTIQAHERRVRTICPFACNICF
jgi:hypothetical protein